MSEFLGSLEKFLVNLGLKGPGETIGAILIIVFFVIVFIRIKNLKG